MSMTYSNHELHNSPSYQNDQDSKYVRSDEESKIFIGAVVDFHLTQISIQYDIGADVDPSPDQTEDETRAEIIVARATIDNDWQFSPTVNKINKTSFDENWFFSPTVDENILIFSPMPSDELKRITLLEEDNHGIKFPYRRYLGKEQSVIAIARLNVSEYSLDKKRVLRTKIFLEEKRYNKLFSLVKDGLIDSISLSVNAIDLEVDAYNPSHSAPYRMLGKDQLPNKIIRFKDKNLWSQDEYSWSAVGAIYHLSISTHKNILSVPSFKEPVIDQEATKTEEYLFIQIKQLNELILGHGRLLVGVIAFNVLLLLILLFK